MLSLRGGYTTAKKKEEFLYEGLTSQKALFAFGVTGGIIKKKGRGG